VTALHFPQPQSDPPHAHGGHLIAAAKKLGCHPSSLIDASASITPFSLPLDVRWSAFTALLSPYPDRSLIDLRGVIARLHGVAPSCILPGNGAAELLTWAGRDAADLGLSFLPQPCFSDYSRALTCWGASLASVFLPLHWDHAFPSQLVDYPPAATLWLTKTHNPTGQLWSRAALEPLLGRNQLVICDEAFLPLVPDGERQSLIPLVAKHSNLVVIRSLTKLYGIAGLRLGYAVAQPQRLQRWASWRDPWPINAVASAVAQELLRHPARYHAWCRQVQRWTAREGAWLRTQLAAIPGLVPMPSAANFLLIRSDRSLEPLREALEHRHRILLRDCRSFEGLDERWLRLGYQSRRRNRRIISAIQKEWR